jgi:TfoX/Sxy family transcriptional regulator of competence genes
VRHDVAVDEPPAYRSVVEQLLADPAVTEAQMMGMPALKVGGKMFGGLSGTSLVLKIGRARVDELVAAGRAEPFDPSGRGRPMRDWAALPEPADDWLTLATDAKALVSNL